MSSNNLGRLVKWIGEDGGWRTGREVLRKFYGAAVRESDYDSNSWILIKESCCGTLTWVEASKLQDAPMRSEYEPAYNANYEQMFGHKVGE